MVWIEFFSRTQDYFPFFYAGHNWYYIYTYQCKNHVTDQSTRTPFSASFPSHRPPAAHNDLHSQKLPLLRTKTPSTLNQKFILNLYKITRPAYKYESTPTNDPCPALRPRTFFRTHLILKRFTILTPRR